MEVRDSVPVGVAVGHFFGMSLPDVAAVAATVYTGILIVEKVHKFLTRNKRK